MNLLNAKTTWSNAEFIVFKLCVASIYIIVGTYFNNFFKSFYVPLLIVFGITVIWTVILWLKKMKDGNNA